MTPTCTFGAAGVASTERLPILCESVLELVGLWGLDGMLPIILG